MMKRVNPLFWAGVVVLTGCLTPGLAGDVEEPGSVERPVAQLGSHRFVHRDRLDSLSFSPDGALLFVAPNGGEAFMWDVATGKKRQVFKLKSSIMSAAFSENGRTVVLAQNGKPVHVFDAVTGEHVAELSGASQRSCTVAVAPDGHLAASADGGQVILWDVGRGEECRRWKTAGKSISALGFSPNSKRLCVANAKGPISIHDLTEKEPPTRVDGGSGFGCWQWIVFAPDGKTLAGSCEIPWRGGTRCSFRIWDAATGEVLHDVPGSSDAGAFSPDGKLLAVSGLEKTRIYDTATGKEVHRLPDCHQHVWSVAFSPDGKVLATGQGQRVRLWDTGKWQEIRPGSGHSEPTKSIAFSPDGTVLAVAGDIDTMIWDLTGCLKNGRLPTLELTAEKMESLWHVLGGEDAWVAHRAAWTLAAGGDAATAFLAKRLRPAPVPEPHEIQALREDLRDPDYDTRELAARKLLGMGIELKPDEREALRRPDRGPIAGRAWTGQDAPPPPPVRFMPPPKLLPLPERLRSSRAVAALELSGVASAESMLCELAKGDSVAPLTREAKGALIRLQQRRPLTK